ncbi:DUF485 domain-containing protein [Robertmurraya andreesenii]|uniref:Uncharacterized membrane protein (DUF485 family) n=1 Tax=Anoxybacillus andreesenii TaxID=1325932 RepID=A0ABT9V171_9BACL|nr:DUF485 domain-containing protein [Robertmurraya andreesenii]MDQ0154687.1 uncharacterized membrane protein (DUF485 family) [Robertmurraya andreesenii]
MEEKVLELIHQKKKRMVPALAAALLFYFLLPLSLIFIPDVMNQPSFMFRISWAWLYAILQIPMTWFFCGLYHRTAKKIERQLDAIDKEESL